MENNTEFPAYFKTKNIKYFTRIEHGLSEVLGRYSSSKFYEPLNYALLNGKRLRPLILLLCFDAIGTGNPIVDNPIPAAIAVELLHTESIIHDDVIDQDVMRREREAFHTRYGINSAILSSDFVLGIVLDIASLYSDSRIGRELSKSVLRMSEGEYSELESIRGIRKTSLEEYMAVIQNKTASLFQSSAKLGGIVAGAKQRAIESLSDFGHNLGIAYQIQDDLLDWDQDNFLERAINTKQSSLQEMSYKFALASKSAIAQLPESEAKERLEELSDFAVTREF